MQQANFNIINKKRVNKPIVLFVLILLFSNFLSGLTGVSFFDFSDEFTMILFFILLLFRKTLNSFEKIIIIVYIYFITISYIIEGSNFFKILLQSLIHLKLFIFFSLGMRYLNIETIKVIMKYLGIITLIGIIVNLGLGNTYNNFFNLGNNFRSGWLRINGFQMNENALGATIAMYYLYLIYKKPFLFKDFNFIIIPTILFLVLIFISGSRSSMIGIIISLLFWILNKGVNVKFFLVLLLILSFPLFWDYLINSEIISLSLENLKSFQDTDDSKYIRAIMLINGYNLMIEFFPFGAGAATFGSLLSEGSVIYEKLGLSHMIFFQEMRGVYDCNIGTILGEFGIIGIFIYLFLLFKMLLNYEKKDLFSKENIVLLAIFLIIIVMSFTKSIFQNGYFTTIFSIIIVYFVKSRKKYSVR